MVTAEGQNISVVIPAFNEELSIGTVITDIRKVLGDQAEIIVVDDGSTDQTAQIALDHGARVVSHPYNKGNGAAVKTGIREARGDVIVLMDGDGQHDPEDIPKLLEKMDSYDMAVGARTGITYGSIHRRIANLIYNDLATYIARVKVLDLTSGFRVVKRQIIAKFIYLLPNTFSYPSTSTLALMKAGYSVCYVPVNVSKRKGKSKIHLVRDGLRFLMIIFKISALFSPFRIFLPVSAVMFGIGFFYSIGTIILDHRFTNMGLLLLTTGLLIFFQGLIAEEIAMMRMERSEEDT